ncbi:MAG: hypothetical protein RLZZ57_2028 [Pseudomonadota bacterium]
MGWCGAAILPIPIRLTPLRSPRKALPSPQGAGPFAQVAELVDAQVSGTCGRKAVKVRVLSWAPVFLFPKRRDQWVPPFSPMPA